VGVCVHCIGSLPAVGAPQIVAARDACVAGFVYLAGENDGCRVGSRVVGFHSSRPWTQRMKYIRVHAAYSNLIIPSEGLEEFKKWVVEMVEASKKLNE
jgi:hypothetical protein